MLTTVYMLIVMSPLASLAMHSKTVVLVVAKECSGDCDICGCSQESRANHTCCCAKKTAKQHDDHETGLQQKPNSNRTETVYKCGCPCDKGKLLAMTGFGSNELLPITASEMIEPLPVETLFTDLTHRLASRYGDPPDPPPRLSLIS